MAQPDISDPIEEIATLTPRQHDVLALVAKGMTNPQIAERLGITRDGVKWHISEILSRLGLDTREEAADLWRWYNGLPYRLHRFAAAAAVRWIVGGLGLGAAAGLVVALAIVMGWHADDVAPLTATVTDAGPVIPPGHSVVVYTAGAGPRDGATTTPTPDCAKCAGRSFPTWKVVAYDTTAGRVLSSFTFGGVGNYPLRALLDGGDVITVTEAKVTRSALDGANAHTLATALSGLTIQDAAISPDGKTLAISEAGPLGGDDLGGVVFVDAADGHVVRRFTIGGPVMPTDAGIPSSLLWRSDGRGVLVQMGNGKAWIAPYTMFLDGTARKESLSPLGAWYLPSPDGMHLAFAEGGECSHSIVVEDLDNDATMSRVDRPGEWLSLTRWSPDGKSLLFADVPATTCPITVDAAHPAAYSLLNVSGGSIQPAKDTVSLYGQWYGDQQLALTCPSNTAQGAWLDWQGKQQGGCSVASTSSGQIRVGGKDVGAVLSGEPVSLLGTLAGKSTPPA